jgi:hypothetical protein
LPFKLVAMERPPTPARSPGGRLHPAHRARAVTGALGVGVMAGLVGGLAAAHARSARPAVNPAGSSPTAVSRTTVPADTAGSAPLAAAPAPVPAAPSPGPDTSSHGS